MTEAESPPKAVTRAPGWWWWLPRFPDHWNTSKWDADEQSTAALKLRDEIMEVKNA